MAKKDEVEQSHLGVSSADIPDLKEKEKERKRGGLAWSGARAPGGVFQGAAGGVARSAASVAGGAAGGAQAGVGLLARIAALGLLGKISAAAAVVVMLVGAGLLGSALLRGAAGSSDAGNPSLGGISSSMKVRSGGSDRIGVDSKGEIAFDPVATAAPAGKNVEEAKPAGEEAPASDASDADRAKEEALAARDRLAHDLSGARLSGSLGGQFGGKNIFAGGGSASAPKFGASAPKFTPKGGKAAPMRPGSVRASVGARSISSKGRSSRAIGQLRLAKGMSVLGAQAGSTEGASSGATNAFEQNSGDGGTLNTAGGPGQTVVSPGTGGGEGVSGGGGAVTVPETFALDSIQAQIDAIRALTKQAQDMKEKGTNLIIIGAVCIVIGIILCAASFGTAGWGFIILGVMLMYSGYKQLESSKDMADQAKQMGDALAARTGEFQSAVVRQCVDDAIANLTSVDACRSVEAEERRRQMEEIRQRDLERQGAINAEAGLAP